MDLRFQKRLLDLSFKMFVKGEGMAGTIKFIPQKTAILPPFEETARPFEVAAPESVGLSEEYINEYLAALEADRDVNLHTVVILRDGRLIFRGAARPYSTVQPQLTYSMSKTVVAMAIGMLIDEGKLALDRRAYSIFPSEKLPAIIGLRSKAITVEHLLTMRAGVLFNEGGAVTEEDWVRAYFESAVKFEPGKNFAYNSMNSYILSAIVSEITGQTLDEFLTPRLWEPLGITSHFWETCQSGIQKGGWGLYLRPYDMAKLGQLMLDEGRFGGRQIISRKWARSMMTPHSKTPDEAGRYDYGYQIWVSPDGREALFNGMFGQNIWLSRDSRTVVAMTNGNCELFQKSPALDLTERFFSKPALGASLPSGASGEPIGATERVIFRKRAWIAEPPEPKEPQKPGFFARLFGAGSKPTAKEAPALPDEARTILGRYNLDRNNAGLLPMLVRLFQNNHTPGVSALTIEEEDGRMFVELEEGKGRYRFEVGFGRHAMGEIDYNGEHYLIAAAAEFATNEDGDRLLKLEINFPELPSSRRVKLYFYGNDLRIKLIEIPGRQLISELLDSASVTMPKSVGLANFAKSKLDIEFVSYKIADAFERSLTAKKAVNKKQKKA